MNVGEPLPLFGRPWADWLRSRTRAVRRAAEASDPGPDAPRERVLALTLEVAARLRLSLPALADGSAGVRHAGAGMELLVTGGAALFAVAPPGVTDLPRGAVLVGPDPWEAAPRGEPVSGVIRAEPDQAYWSDPLGFGDAYRARVRAALAALRDALADEEARAESQVRALWRPEGLD